MFFGLSLLLFVITTHVSRHSLGFPVLFIIINEYGIGTQCQKWRQGVYTYTRLMVIKADKWEYHIIGGSLVL